MFSMEDVTNTISLLSSMPSGSIVFVLIGAGIGGLIVLKTTNWVKGIVEPLDIKIDELEKDITDRLDKEQADNSEHHDNLKSMVEDRLVTFKDEIFLHLDSHREENIRLVESLSKNMDNLQRAILDIKSI